MRVLPIVCAGLLAQAAAGQSAKQPAAGDAEASLRDGTVAQEHGDLKTAIADFRRALALKPDLVQARANLGAALAAAGQMDAAIEEDGRVLEISPQNEAVRMNLAMAYYRTGNLNQARLEFEKLHALHPADLNTAILLGYTYNKLRREADAAALLAPLEPGREDDFDFEYVYAYALIGSGKQDAGLPRMEKLAKAKNSAEAWLLAGSARFYRGEMQTARADLDAAVELNPKLPGLFTMAGQARYAMKDMPAATSAFQAALRADPTDFVANRDLGAMRLKEGDTANAKPLLELALQLHPTDPLTRLEMAKLDEQTGKYAEAAAILEALTRTDPNWLDAHWLLAAVYAELNRPEDGKHERALAHDIEIKQKAATPKKD
ncbi:MAG TPA: tetratricopeptide repeat protein [Terracidiphilus sp.]|nr:tetratricopeptide repeat protein [Terracidiphilus sp.]